VLNAGDLGVTTFLIFSCARLASSVGVYYVDSTLYVPLSNRPARDRLMRILFTAYILISCLSLAQECSGQMISNADWTEYNGLSVASSQTVVVPATKLRFFTAIDAVDDEPRTAIENLNLHKKSAITALKEIKIRGDSVQFTSTRILEWMPQTERSFGWRPKTGVLLPSTSTEWESYTARAYFSFDIPLGELNADERLLLVYDTNQQLRKHAVFESSEIIAIYVGEVTKAQSVDATKKAYEEARANAKSIAAHTERSLGKLLALTSTVSGRSRYLSEPSYGYSLEQMGEKEPLAYFAPAENEVFGVDGAELSQTHRVELRFEIE